MKAEPSRFDDLFSAFGRIAVRRMFGGEGLYADGVMIGLVMDDRVYLKTDDVTRPAFRAEDCEPFTYEAKGGKRVSLGYCAIPDRLYDDPQEFADWARAAHKVARAAAAKKPKKK